MAAYIIADVRITDPRAYEEYRRQVVPLVERFGGRFLVRGGPHTVLEGNWQPQRLVVLEFPDMETLKAWYDSPEYGPVMALRLAASSADLVAVEGA